MMKKKFKDEEFKICTYPKVRANYYMISNYGRVYNIVTKKMRNMKHVSSNGYISNAFATEVPGKQIHICIHRLVAWEFCDGYSEEHNEVNHKDTDHLNNYYKNLEWCTPSYNNKHAYIMGREPVKCGAKGPRPKVKGESNPKNKFSEKLVRKICKLFQDGFTKKQILKQFGYTKKDNQDFYTLITNIKSGKAWKHIKEEYDF